MPELNFFILYVESPLASAGFYTELFGHAPVDSAPTFVLFALANGNKLGLWARAGVEPAATAPAGSGELCFPQADRAALDALHESWQGRGWSIIQAPTEMDFGRTFTALDPDGNRLRAFVPNPP